MILIDFSGLAMSALFSQTGQSQPISEGMIRHLILNSLRMYNLKYRGDYGQMVICCDSGNLWRKKTFPQYKANRKTAREASDIDWDEFYRIRNLIESEICEFLPVKIVRVDTAEADDIIAVLAQSAQEFGQGENVMIISTDKDFIQLQKFKNVKQFSPMQQKQIIETNPALVLKEKILKGDSGDGVPNVFSPDDMFLTEGTRQKPMTSKRMEDFFRNWDKLEVFMDSATYKNFLRNRNMIDFDYIPSDVKEKILETFWESKVPPNSGVLNYLISKRCAQLTSCASEFFPNT